MFPCLYFLRNFCTNLHFFCAIDLWSAYCLSSRLFFDFFFFFCLFRVVSSVNFRLIVIFSRFLVVVLLFSLSLSRFDFYFDTLASVIPLKSFCGKLIKLWLLTQSTYSELKVVFHLCHMQFLVVPYVLV